MIFALLLRSIGRFDRIMNAHDGYPKIAAMRPHIALLFVLGTGCGQKSPPLSVESQLTRAGQSGCRRQELPTEGAD
jgi:hypothetical protein